MWQGDFNATSLHSMVAATVALLGLQPAETSLKTTRWQGREVIDWYATNMTATTSMQDYPFRVSDHKILDVSLDWGSTSEDAPMK